MNRLREQNASEKQGTPPIILIVGPTAGGKTELSLRLAAELDGECLCADSMQVYRGMDIGTAKPTPEERNRIPHHLLDLVDPREAFSVDRWLEQAERAITRTQEKSRIPIIVGGTNLYIQSVLWGLMDGPAPDEALREKLAAQSSSALREELVSVDPEAAARIHPNDRRRTIRALEVFKLTGSPITARQGQWEHQPRQRDVILIGLDYPPELINQRINARVREMMEQGFLDEVRHLHEGVGFGVQAIEALGYRQLVDHLEGHGSLAEAIEEIKIRTRRFAKHQRTWFRRFRARAGGLWIPCQDFSPQSLFEQSLKYIHRGPHEPASAGVEWT